VFLYEGSLFIDGKGIHELTHPFIHGFQISVIDPSVELLQQVVVFPFETFIFSFETSDLLLLVGDSAFCSLKLGPDSFFLQYENAS
jgi:hypothetical protein